MKHTLKTFAVTALAAAVSFNAFAGDDGKAVESEKIEGIEYGIGAGPMYDPDFDFGVSLNPSLAYQFDTSKASSTNAMAIYGSNDNWNVGVDNYWYLFDNRLKAQFYASYTDASDLTFFDPFVTGRVQPIAVKTIDTRGHLTYRIFENAYIGPSFRFTKRTNERNADPAYLGNNSADNKLKQFGVFFSFDSRDYQYAPTRGFYFEAEYLKSDDSSFGSEATSIVGKVNCSDFKPGQGYEQCVEGLRSMINMESKFETLRLDARTYKALSPQTTLAFRASAVLNSKEAPKNATVMDQTGTSLGFTREVEARSVVGAQAQIRHWLNDQWGVASGIAVGRGIHLNAEDKDGVYYAGSIGLRYMLIPKTKLALRIDLTQSNQEDEATLLYFRVGETF